MKVVASIVLVLSMFHCFAQKTDSSTNESFSRQSISLNGAYWRLWLDEKAEWINDSLYAPGEVPALSKLPVNEPTGGWAVLNNNSGVPCSVPASIEAYFSKGINTYRYHGVSWFWNSTHIPMEWKGKIVKLNIGKARLRVEVFVNNTLVGYDICSETPLSVDLSDALVYGQTNQIAIRLTNPGGHRGWGDLHSVNWGKYQLPPGHDFSGLDDVVLTACPLVYISDVFVKNLMPANARNIEVQVSINNTTETSVQHKINLAIKGTDVTLEKTVNCLRGINTYVFPLTVANANLWSVNSPNLYDCEVSLDNGDILKQRFGFRVFEVKKGTSGSDNFYLNGERFRHRTAIDWGYYSLTGFYATPEMARKSVEAAKILGQNGINHHRRIGETWVNKYADEMGVAILSEPGGFHVNMSIENRNQGWINVSDGSVAGKIMMEKIRRMLIRDRNHPSILIYNLCNENNGWDSLRYKSMKLIAALDGTTLIVNTSGDDQINPEQGKEFCSTLKHQGFIPKINPYETEIRGDHHDPHNGPNDAPRYRDEGFFDPESRDTSFVGTYYLGEVLSPTGPINCVKSYESREKLADGARGYDLNNYEGSYHKLVKAFHDWNMSTKGTPYIRTPEDISIQAGRGMMYTQGRDAQSILCNNHADGYALNGWTTGPQSEGDMWDWDSAILDEDRNLKGPKEDFLYWTRPLQIAITRKNGKHFKPGQTADFEAWLINENQLTACKAKVLFTATDGLGNELDFKHEIPVDITGGDCCAQSLGVINLPLTETMHAGYITFHASLLFDDKIIAEGTEQIILQNRGSFATELSKHKIAVVNWDAAKTALSDAKVKPVPVKKAGIILSGSCTKDAAKLWKQVENGKILILKFDSVWAELLYNQNILTERVTEWGGQQTGGWTGNGWGYLCHFTGTHTFPGKEITGTNSWESTENPVGFYPFASTYPLSVYGLHVARPWTAIMPPQKSAFGKNSIPTLSVILGVIDYGKGKIVLAPSYPVESNNAFNDLLFYNLIDMACENDW